MMNFKMVYMNKKIFISLFILFALLLSFSAVSANDLNESQTLELDDVEITATHDSGDLYSADELKNGNEESGAYLELDNDADIENIYVGDLVTWIISVENLGPDIANNVKVYDELPDGLQYLSHSSTKGVFNPETGIWDIGDLKVEDGLVYLFITCKAINTGEKINKAWLTSDTKNLNNETFEEEEIDVFDHHENEFKNHDIVKKQDSILKSAGNPLFLILMCLFLIFQNVIVKR